MNLSKSSVIYWNKFYKKINIINRPTNFSFFCLKFLKSYEGTLFDVGCGNGRGTVVFNRNNVNSIGFDQSSSSINNNKKKHKSLKKNSKKLISVSTLKKKLKKI